MMFDKEIYKELMHMFLAMSEGQIKMGMQVCIPNRHGYCQGEHKVLADVTRAQIKEAVAAHQKPRVFVYDADTRILDEDGTPLDGVDIHRVASFSREGYPSDIRSLIFSVPDAEDDIDEGALIRTLIQVETDPLPQSGFPALPGMDQADNPLAALFASLFGIDPEAEPELEPEVDGMPVGPDNGEIH
jgi:hypothetical protein